MVFKGDSVFWKLKFVYNIIKMVKVCVKHDPKHQHAPIALFGSNFLPF